MKKQNNLTFGFTDVAARRSHSFREFSDEEIVKRYSAKYMSAGRILLALGQYVCTHKYV